MSHAHEAIEQDFEILDDDATPIVCMVCGGDWIRLCQKTGSGRYRKVECRWCFHGAMNKEQLLRWKSWSNNRRKRRELEHQCADSSVTKNVIVTS